MRHNLFAVAVAVMLQAAIGYTVYATEPLHSLWMNAWHLDASMLAGDSSQPYFLSIMGSLVSVYCISWMVQKLKITEWVGGAGLGIILWVGFCGSALLVHYRFARVAPAALYIDMTKDFLCIVSSSVLLAIWPPR